MKNTNFTLKGIVIIMAILILPMLFQFGSTGCGGGGKDTTKKFSQTDTITKDQLQIRLAMIQKELDSLKSKFPTDSVINNPSYNNILAQLDSLRNTVAVCLPCYVNKPVSNDIPDDLSAIKRNGLIGLYHVALSKEDISELSTLASAIPDNTTGDPDTIYVVHGLNAQSQQSYFAALKTELTSGLQDSRISTASPCMYPRCPMAQFTTINVPF